MLSSKTAVRQPAFIDQFRCDALAALGYEISEDSIQPEITAFNRIIMGKLPSTIPHSTLTHPSFGNQTMRKRLGETRAYETVQSLNVANIKEAQALSKRPSREWLRSFDLSYWVDDNATGQLIAAALAFLSQRIFLSQLSESREGAEEEVHKDVTAVLGYLISENPATPGSVDNPVVVNITIFDRYTDPTTRQLACTYRIEIRSSTVSITKADAALLRKNLCRTLRALSPMLPANFALRGE
jgi:hypothetical protein